MTFAAASAMRRSASLKGRIESSAYAHGQTMQWVDRNIAALCATDSWVSKWTDAYTAAISVGDVDADLGIRTDVIADDDIDAAVAALVDQQAKDAADATAAQASTDQQIADLTQQVADLKAQVAALTSVSTVSEAPAAS